MSRLKLSVVCARVEQSISKREGKSTSHSEMISRGEGSIDVDGQWIMAGQVAIVEGKGTNACFLMRTAAALGVSARKHVAYSEHKP